MTLASSDTLGLKMALCLGVGNRLAQDLILTSKGCEEVLEKRLPLPLRPFNGLHDLQHFFLDAGLFV